MLPSWVILSKAGSAQGIFQSGQWEWKGTLALPESQSSLRLEPFFLLPFSAPIFFLSLPIQFFFFYLPIFPFLLHSLFSFHPPHQFLPPQLAEWTYPLCHFLLIISFFPICIFSFLFFPLSSVPLLLTTAQQASWVEINSVFSLLHDLFHCLPSSSLPPVFLLFLILYSLLATSSSLLNWLGSSVLFICFPSSYL